MKVRRVDFAADEWLGGTSRLSDAECGIYIRACALIYSHGGPIPRAALRGACKSRGARFDTALDCLLQHGKLIALDGDLLDQARCEIELRRARRRIDAGQEGAQARWGTDHEPTTNLPRTCHEPATKRTRDEHVSAEINILPDAVAMPTKNKELRQSQENSVFINNNNTLGCAWAHAREAPPEPTDEDKAHVDRLVADMLDVLALPPNGLRNGVHNADAYREAITATKRDQWLNNLSLFVGEAFDGMPERMAAWEAIEQARAAGSRAKTPAEVRRAVDELSRLREKSIAYAEAAE